MKRSAARWTGEFSTEHCCSKRTQMDIWDVVHFQGWQDASLFSRLLALILNLFKRFWIPVSWIKQIQNCPRNHNTSYMIDHRSSEDCSKPVHEYREKRHWVAENHDSRFQLRVCKAQNTSLKQKHWLARQNFDNFRPFHLDVFQPVWDDTLAIQGCVTQSSCGRSRCDIADHSPASLCFLILDVTKTLIEVVGQSDMPKRPWAG